MEVDTGFLNLNYRSQLVLGNSEFHNTRGMIGGVLYATGSSVVEIKNNSKFHDSKSLDGGSTLYFSNTNMVNISNSSFANNGDGDIYLI